MARKKTYPGGFRLTLATARALVVQEFGTAKGLGLDYYIKESLRAEMDKQ